MLMLALSRQNIAVVSDITATIVLYEREQKQFAIETAVKRRCEGCRIQLMKKFYEKTIDDYVELGRRSFIDRIVYIDADGNTSEIKIDTKHDKNMIEIFLADI